LQTSADNLERACKRFPKELKGLPIFKKVEETILNFKDSLPLIVSLKNESMKPRHWQKLMEITGVKFDSNMKAVTLDHIFAMELHRYTETIEEIVNESIQELKIESEIH